MFVRKDMPVVTQVVQTGHACLELGKKYGLKDGDQSPLVVFGVNNEESLIRVASRLDKLGIGYAMFYEPDYNLGYTTICTELVTPDKREYFKNYNLLKY